MKIIANLHHLQTGSSKIRFMELDDDATIDTLFEALEIRLAEVECERYYRVQNYSLAIAESTLQYVIVNGKVHWNPSYIDTKLMDFFSTHGITDNSIYIRYERGGRGGGFVDYLFMWDQVYSILEHSVVLITGTDYAVRLSKFVGAHMRRRDPPAHLASMSPGNLLSFIGQRRQWNGFELADLANLSPERAKFFLKGCGYEYDGRRQMFTATDATDQFFDVINTTAFTHPPVDLHTTSRNLSTGKNRRWLDQLLRRKP